MSPSWTSHPQDLPDKQHSTSAASKSERQGIFRHSTRFWLILCAVFLAIAIGLGVGLGVGLTRGSSSDSDSTSSTPTNTTSSSPPPDPNNTTELFWHPIAGTTWQIELLYALNNTSPNVSVYDIDLFDNPTSTIADLHAQNSKVICYFSAGSYEPDRPDSGNFSAKDKGKELDGWPGEYWLNTSSANVRSIMSRRISLAASKGCDGVDPDNIDGYDNKNGLDLTTSDAIDYVTFLANSAHALNMSMGLKNGAAIINETIGLMQWEVNEQCVQYGECDLFRPFIDAGKPVFHIEYPDSAPDISATTKASICEDSSARGFSTVLKNMDLDDFIDAC